MKAAMQAAMELEGRLEALETSFEAFQERFGAFQDSAATKAELEAIAEREAGARQELLVAMAKKADLEQLGQCLQAVRHELGEVVKRKANSELVQTSLHDLRAEVAQLVGGQRAGLEALENRVEDLHREVLGELQTKAEQQVRALQVLAAEAARRSDLDQIEQFIDERLPALLQRKADVAAVQHLEGAHAQLAEALQGKADVCEVQAAMQTFRQDSGRKADADQLAQNIQALRQEVLRSLQCKANTDLLEQRIQTVRTECLQEAQQRILDSLRGKADLAQVDQRIQDVQGLHDEMCKELGQKFEELSSAKADREKVVEIVEAVRDEMIEVVKQKPDFEEHVNAMLEQMVEQLNSKADESKLEQRLHTVRQDIVSMVTRKADLDVVADRVGAMEQALADQVARNIEASREELSVLIGHKADMELMDRRFHNLQQELVEAFKSRLVAPRMRSSSKEGAEGKRRSSQKGMGYWKDGQFIAEDDEDVSSEVTTAEGWGDRLSDAHTMCDMEEWMDHRMRLVKIELTKLVETKADVDQVNKSMQNIRQEVTDHVDNRVQEAQESLNERMDQQAQAVRKELKADVNLLTRCMTQVEENFEALQGDKPLQIKSFSEMLREALSPDQAEPPPPEQSVAAAAEPVVESKATSQRWRPSSARPKKEQEEFSADDLRTRRVRDLLTQLVVQE